MVALSRFSAFIRCESGAASVDWVVLSAACVGMGLGVTNVVATEMSELSHKVRTELQMDMMTNPFDSTESDLASNGCGHLYLDPFADPGASAAADAYHAATGCAVDFETETTPSGGGSQANNGWGNGDQDAPGNSGGNNNAENAYVVIITDDDD